MTGRETGNLFIGLGIGLAIGTIVGLMVAPQSGSETRQLIKDKVGKVADTVSSKVKTTIDKVHRK
jgi:gas vesicle protein